MREFISALDSAGYLTNSVPKIRYEREPSGALGVAAAAAFAAASALVCSGGWLRAGSPRAANQAIVAVSTFR